MGGRAPHADPGLRPDVADVCEGTAGTDALGRPGMACECLNQLALEFRYGVRP
jgi:hypothetical protein